MEKRFLRIWNGSVVYVFVLVLWGFLEVGMIFVLCDVVFGFDVFLGLGGIRKLGRMKLV